MRRLAVVANCVSGGADDADGRRKAIRDAFEAAGARPAIRCVPGDGLAEAGRAAVADGVDVLVAAGGDGSVSALAGVAAEAGCGFAVLPMGTLNHFAKDAGLPLDLAEAARVAAEAPARPVDLGEVNGRPFVNNVSLGLYARAVRERRLREAEGASKPVAKVRGLGSALLRLRPHPVAIAVDGVPRPLVRSPSFVFVGNGVYETDLGRLGRRERLTEGCLSLYTTRRPGRRAVLALAGRALLGRLDESRDFETHQARQVVVESRHPMLQAAIDGELAWLRTPLRCRTRPGALRLVREAP